MTTGTTNMAANVRRGARVIGGLAGVVFALLLMGCPKPPPPPPQPPPPQAPPPPPPVSLESLGQDMSVDARVSFAPGLEVEHDQEALGRAIVTLADTLAKGDAEKLGAMLDASGKALLNDLTTSGAWAEQTKGLEAVRVVFVGGGVSFTRAGATREQMQAILDASPDTPEPVRKAFLDAMEKMQTPEGRGELRANTQAMLDAAKAGGASPERIALIEEIMRTFDPAPTEASGGTGVLIALQDAKGAYLTGWRAVQVGETWTFGGAPSSPAARPLAQNFDGIGAAGFMGGSAEAAAPVEQPKKEGDSADAGEKAEEGGGGGGGGGEDPGRRKSTPAGPIRIPGGGG